jgi:hypothetical protein
MRRIKLTIGMFALVVGATAAFAFAPAPVENTAKSGDSLRHFFDANSGAYLGQRLESQQQTICGSPQVVDCAYGYSSISGSAGNEEPVGGILYTARKASN